MSQKGRGIIREGDLLQKPTSKRGFIRAGVNRGGGGGLDRAFTVLTTPRPARDVGPLQVTPHHFGRFPKQLLGTH